MLLTADLHCTDNPRDAYRFKLFDWLAEQQAIYKTRGTFILGDLTNEKDKHSSMLVNQLIDGLTKLRPPIYIPKGNHDYIKEDLPFFKFLSNIEGITFCVEPTFIKELKVFMIPHQNSQQALDKALTMAPEGCLVMMHQTLTGAISDTGSRLTGMTVTPNKARKLYSGDIHVPHECESVTYVGSPYHTRHGTNYKPRVLLLNDDKEVDLYFPAPKKLSIRIRDLSEMPPLEKGDQIKVVFELPRSEKVEWIRHKQAVLDYCKEKGIENFGTEVEVPQARKRVRLDNQPSRGKSNQDYFKAFCAAEKVPLQIKDAGQNLLGDDK